jgi:1-deoxy-D-xylulose-5-phosphate synthase
VVFCLDRAGAVEDGPTHHGIQDCAFWLGIPGLDLLQPMDVMELQAMLRAALAREQAVILRYPRGEATAPAAVAHAPLAWGTAEVLRAGDDLALWAVGREAARACEVADNLAGRGIRTTVVNPRFLRPLDADLLRRHALAMPLVTLEDHYPQSGLGGLAVRETARLAGVRLLTRGWPDLEVVPWGDEGDLRRRYRLDRVSLVEDIARFISA